MNYLDLKGGDEEGGAAVSSRSFDLLNSMIYDLKQYVHRPKMIVRPGATFILKSSC